MIKLSLKLVVLLILISSCSSKFSLQKRRYNKGFYFTHNSQQKKSSTQIADSKTTSSQLIQKNCDNTVLAQNSIPEKEPEQTLNNVVTHQNNITIENSTKENSEKNFIDDDITKPLIKSNHHVLFKHTTTNQKKYIGKKNDAFDLINNIYIGYVIVSFIIACIVVAFFLFQTFPPLEAIAIIIIGVLVLAALAGIGAWANSGGW